MTAPHCTDIVVFGGGIAGLWLLNRLHDEGYDAVFDTGFFYDPAGRLARLVARLPAALRARAEAMVEAFDPGEQHAIFSTQEQARKVDDYFLDSADKMRCFFEEEAFDEQGRLRQAKALSINKIGHALHDLDPVFDAFSHGPALAAVAAGLGLAQPQLWQSMYIFKQPGIGGEVGWHQDATFFETEPISVASSSANQKLVTLSNGCLWVAPGAHLGPLRQRFVRPEHRFWWRFRTQPLG